MSMELRVASCELRVAKAENNLAEMTGFFELRFS